MISSLAPVELDDPVAAHALAEVLVRRADEHLLDAGVVVGHGRRAGHGVVGLELDHGQTTTPSAASASSSGHAWDHRSGSMPSPVL